MYIYIHTHTHMHTTLTGLEQVSSTNLEDSHII